MLIFLSVSLALAFGWLVLAIAHLPGRVPQAIGLWLLASGQIVSAFLLLNGLLLLNQRRLVVTVQVMLTTLALAAWLWRGRPSLELTRRLSADIDDWKKELGRFPQLIVLGILLLVAFTFSGMLVLVVVPNTHDSMTIHLSRVGYWLQNGSFFPWQAFDMRPVIYPVNAALLLFWTVLFHGTDELAGFVQWIAAGVLMVCVYGLGRLLQGSRAQSAFAALIFGSFPLVLMQSSSTQIDLTAAALFVPAVYFLLLGIKTDRPTPLIFSGLALGLAVGAKQTVLFFLPGLALFVLLQFNYWKSRFRRLALWLTSAFVCTLLLGVYMYAVNKYQFGSPFGPPQVVASSSSSLVLGRLSQNLGYNIPRLLYDAVDFSGLPAPLEQTLLKAKSEFVKPILASLRISLEKPVALAPNHTFSYLRLSQLTEEQAWYGPLSLILLLPAVLVVTIRAARSRDTIRLGLVLLAVSGFMIDVLQRPGYDEFQGRYLVSSVAVLAPFMGIWVSDTKASVIFLWVVSAIAIMTSSYTLLYNPSKPVVSERIHIFSASRAQEYSLTAHNLEGYIRLVDRYLPERATVAYYSPGYIWDYLLFGEHFRRRVIPVVDESLLDNDAWLNKHGVNYILVNRSEGDWPSISPLFKAIQEVEGEWRLYKSK